MNNKFEGKAFVVEVDGRLIDDIDTDMIFHNEHLAITDIEKMGPFAFGNLDGYENFPEMAKDYDVLIVGKNFGAGSSRQQAVDCFKALGIDLIIGQSFGAIYWRNTVNSGMPIIKAPMIENGEIETGDTIEIDLEKGEIVNKTKNKTLSQSTPITEVQRDILEKGSLFEYAK